MCSIQSTNEGITKTRFDIATYILFEMQITKGDGHYVIKCFVFHFFVRKPDKNDNEMGMRSHFESEYVVCFRNDTVFLFKRLFLYGYT